MSNIKTSIVLLGLEVVNPAQEWLEIWTLSKTPSLIFAVVIQQNL